MAGNVSWQSDKAARRVAVEAWRRALSDDEVAQRGDQVQRRLVALLFSAPQRPPDVLALYAAQPFEVPLAAVFHEARARGVRCAFPVVVKGSRVLRFREVGAADELTQVGPLKLAQPRPDAPEVPLAALNVVVVPGVAFTRDGRRLGRGGGYYDATLASAPQARRVAVAFGECVVADLPETPTDERVDVLVTETETLTFPARR